MSKKILLVAFVIAVVGALGVKGWIERRGERTTIHMSYSFFIETRPNASDDYMFDGYYTTQAVELFGKSVAAWSMSPEVIHELFVTHKLTPPAPSNLPKTIKAEMVAPQVLHITIQDTSAPTARRLATGIQQALPAYVEQYNTEGHPPLQFRIVPTTPWEATQQPSATLIAVIVGIILFIGSINLSFVWHIVRQDIP